MKGLYQFEGQYKVSKGWFKLESGFLNTTCSTSHSQLYKELIKYNIEDQDTELYTTFIVPFDEEFIKTNYEKNTKYYFSIRSTSSGRNISVQTPKGKIFL